MKKLFEIEYMDDDRSLDLTSGGLVAILDYSFRHLKNFTVKVTRVMDVLEVLSLNERVEKLEGKVEQLKQLHL